MEVGRDRLRDPPEPAWSRFSPTLAVGFQPTAAHLTQGRGLTIVDTRKTYPVPTGLGHAISYLPAGLVTEADDARMVREYDPEREVVVGMLRANGDEDLYRLGSPRLTPKQAYEQTPKQ